MKILDQGIVYDAVSAPPHRRFCAFTNTTVLAEGRILVAFHAGSAKESPDENVLMRLSADGGRSWETVCDGLPPLAVDGQPGSWRITAGRPSWTRGICSPHSGGLTAPTERSLGAHVNRNRHMKRKPMCSNERGRQ